MKRDVGAHFCDLRKDTRYIAAVMTSCVSLTNTGIESSVPHQRAGRLPLENITMVIQFHAVRFMNF